MSELVQQRIALLEQIHQATRELCDDPAPPLAAVTDLLARRQALIDRWPPGSDEGAPPEAAARLRELVATIQGLDAQLQQHVGQSKQRVAEALRRVGRRGNKPPRAAPSPRPSARLHNPYQQARRRRPASTPTLPLTKVTA